MIAGDPNVAGWMASNWNSHLINSMPDVAALEYLAILATQCRCSIPPNLDILGFLRLLLLFFSLLLGFIVLALLGCP